MTNLNYEISTIKYAMDNGFTEVNATTKNGEVTFQGAFGYIVVSEEDAKVLQDLINSYKAEQVEVVKEVEVFEKLTVDNLKVGMTFTRGRMIRTITRFDHDNFAFPAVIYAVKDGTERFVRYESFVNFANKKGTERIK